MEVVIDRVKSLPDLEIVHKAQEGTYIVFHSQTFGAEPLKLGEDIGYFLEGIVNEKIFQEGYLDDRWDSSSIASALEILRQKKLIVDIDDVRSIDGKSSETIPRFHISSITSMQFDLLNKPRHFQWLKKIARPAVVKILTVASLAFATVGFILLAVNWRVFYDAASHPLSIFHYILILVTTITVISIHEWSHALALVYCGGMPRRIGFMLFYFSPAFFCDVTDGWRFEDKRKRVIVALAGVISTFGIAGVFTILFLIFGTESVWLGVVAPMLYVMSVFNLLPFVKFDGYIALMTYLDESHLRDHAMNDWKKWIACKFSGTSTNDIRLWRVVYGLACSAFPLLLVGSIPFAYLSIQGTLEGFVITWISIIALTWFVVRGLLRVYGELKKAQVSYAKRGLFFFFTVMSIVSVLSIPLSHNIKGTYWIDERGKVLATLPDSKDMRGRDIELRENGFYFARHVGNAHWDGEEVVVTSIPLQLAMPNLLIDGDVDAEMGAIVLEVESLNSLPRVGTFKVIQGKKALGVTLAEQLFRNPFPSMKMK